MAACTPNYVYRPAANATATIKGHPAADYPIPPTAPQGDVRLASFGVTEIRPSRHASENEKAVHLRMIVSDNSQAPWTLDTRQEVIALPDGQQLAPAYVTTHEGPAGLPLVTVAPGSKRTIDLFYPLPPNMGSASKVPEFDAVWHVETPQQDVTERTPFDRLQIEPATAYGYGPEWETWHEVWGGPFWYDPMYPGYRGDIFIGAPHWDGEHEGGGEHGGGWGAEHEGAGEHGGGGGHAGGGGHGGGGHGGGGGHH
jgi:hypothetical protein